MTREEVAQLLAAAATIDPRAPQPGELVLRIWTGMLADVPMKAAERALWAHYRQTRETIQPADIVNWWREQRRHAPEERERPPFDPELIHRGVDRVMAALAARKGLELEAAESEAGARRLLRSVECPHCKASIGQPCVSYDGRPLTKRPAHPAREDAALAASADLHA
ncbi:hypothetical protein BAY59_31390 [Prauserella coralliicola]|nr:hypothetical protein BAY59_31390 [Prauserella coralliicola]